MAITLSLFCLLVAVILFAIAAFWDPYRDRISNGGLFFLALSFLASTMKITQG